MTADNITIGERIAGTRKLRGMSQRELADMTGFNNRVSISKIEIGNQKKISVEKMDRIAKVLDVSLYYLYGYTDEMKRQELEDVLYLSNIPVKERMTLQNKLEEYIWKIKNG